jgi:hypothetical protein
LWRRIHPQWIVQLSDGNVRPSSAAFLDGYTGEVSVHLATLTNKDSVLANHDPDSLAEILASVPRSLGHALVRDPTPEDVSHALICPPPSANKKQRKSDARRMAEAARWIWLAKPD